MSNPAAFRLWLRRLRQERGLTQDDLGELVGYAGQTIRKIEGGTRRPSLHLAARLAQALQLTPEEQAAWVAAARETAGPEEPQPAGEPLRRPAPSPGLPVYLTPFVGREREQADLARLLGRPDCRLVTALGPGGVGKTRLAVEVARTIGGFADGVAFVSLAPAAAPQAIVPAIGEAIGFAFAGTGDLLAQLVGELRDRRTLLVLDNVEHLLDADGVTLGIVGQLLAGAGGVTVLATSRERLKLAGEWVLEVAGLPVPSPRAAGPAAAYPALALFVEHAQRVSQGFHLSAENEAAVVTICRLVDGLPLGIELAAAWTRMLSPQEIGRELAAGLDTTHLAAGALPQRHHSLRAVVDHSWRLLGPAERAALRRLAVFHGGFTREAAAAVAGAGLDVLACLADKSLLRRAPSGRYDLHEIIRQYADARLREDPGEHAAARDQHARFYTELLSEQEPLLKGAQQTAGLATLAAEIDNIRAAWQHAVERRWLDTLERAVEMLQWFYEYRSWHQEGVSLFAQAADQLRADLSAGAGSPHARALGRILGHFGYLAARVGALERARDALAESYALLEDGRDQAGLARTLVHRGIVDYWVGDYPGARRALERGTALAETAGERWIVALGQSWGSIVAHALGAYPEAERLFRAAIAAWRATSNPRAILWCSTYCSITLIALGKYDEAEQVLRESLALGHATDDRYGIAMALHHLGRVALQRQKAEAAIYLFRETLALFQAIETWDVARTLNDLAAALWMAGQRAEAGCTYAEALTTAVAINATPDALSALSGLATQLAGDNRHAAAFALAARVLADPAAHPDARGLAAEAQAAARPHLSAEQAAALAVEAAGRPLAAIAAELAPRSAHA